MISELGVRTPEPETRRPEPGTWNRLAVSLCLAAAVQTAQPPPVKPWMNVRSTAQDRAAALVAQMTLDEKLAMVHGVGFAVDQGYAGRIAGNERLGIPPLSLADGPNGVGNGSTGGTSFPAAAVAAASWDTTLVDEFGAAMAREQLGKGHQVALAPTINILRVPQWGRAFETFGEDPFLTARLAVAEIRGIQREGVIATAKHFAANNQETRRQSIDVQVSPRALREIYLPAFEAAAREARVGAVMCAYNQVNGQYACENTSLLNDVLKREWGFAGFVMSDWYATHSTARAAAAGLDMEMPGGSGPLPEFFGSALKKAVEAGELERSRLDDMVRRILASMFRAGLFDRPLATAQPTVTSDANQSLARRIVEQGTVLLKNDSAALPLTTAVKTIAVIGDAAGAHARLTGGGSAEVKASRQRLPLQAIIDRAGAQVKVTYARGTLGTGPLPAVSGPVLTTTGGSPGLDVSFYASADLTGAAALSRVDASLDANWPQPPAPGLPRQWSALWRGMLNPAATGTYRLSIAGTGVGRLYVEDRLVATLSDELFGGVAHALVEMRAGRPLPIRVEYAAVGLIGADLHLGWQPPEPDLTNAAIAAAQQSEVAIVFVNDLSTEGGDRSSLGLPGDQDRLISTIARANPRTVVVLNTGGPVLMPWASEVEAILQVGYPGQEYGDGLAALLFGDANPSGRLTATYPVREDQTPASDPLRFPGDAARVRYDEQLLVGYRGYDARGDQPLFPFGHGLSYTSFKYGDVAVTERGTAADRLVTATLSVSNAGKAPGAETVQLYVAFPPTSGEPPRQLKGFQKVVLAPGQAREVVFRLDARAFSIWDESTSSWRVPPGEFEIAVGSSSRDIRTTARLKI